MVELARFLPGLTILVLVMSYVSASVVASSKLDDGIQVDDAVLRKEHMKHASSSGQRVLGVESDGTVDEAASAHTEQKVAGRRVTLSHMDLHKRSLASARYNGTHDGTDRCWTQPGDASSVANHTTCKCTMPDASGHDTDQPCHCQYQDATVSVRCKVPIGPSNFRTACATDSDCQYYNETNVYVDSYADHHEALQNQEGSPTLAPTTSDCNSMELSDSIHPCCWYDQCGTCNGGPGCR